MTCHLCKQHYTSPHRLRVHLLQHYIMTFCPCGAFSYHRDYILRHRRTMNCFQGNIYDVDELSYPRFLELIQLFVSDQTRQVRLSQGFPASREITHGPVTKPPNYRKPSTARQASSSTSLPNSLPCVLLQRVETQSSRPLPAIRSPSPLPPPICKRLWNSSSPARRRP